MTFFQKPLGATLLLGSALGTPYILFETEPGEQIRRAVAFDATSLEITPPENTQLGNAPPVNAPPVSLMLESLQNPVLPPSVRLSGLDPLAPASDFQPPIDLREVLRFDIDPDFVYRRFARVSTVLSDLSLDGLRVPLVSGTQAYDVAGSLTYYFDINKTLRRIQMQGVTGDARGLIELMVQHYRLHAEPSLGGQLLSTRWNNRVTSFMHVAPAPVVTSASPNARFAFYLEINPPADHYGLSQEAMQMLVQAQAAKRW
ncbi:MAG: hypothetical protein NT168_06675 [Planctomycetota bacterium]|nr:hypothetical protein [Planctomycetota bacterium]